MKKNMHNSAKSRKVYFLLLFVISCAPLFTLAADQSFVPLTSIPGFGSLGNTPSLPAFFNSLYKLCIGAAAVIAVLQIMRAGVAIMQSSGSVTANKEAKELISSAIIGLVLVLSPYVVFSVINPNILKLDLNVSSLEVPLNKVDTGGPSVQTSDLSSRTEHTLQCADVTAKKFVNSTSNNACTNLGEGYVNSDCCENTPFGQTCCAYHPSLVKTPDTLPPGEVKNGNFTLTLYTKDTSTGEAGACLISEFHKYENAQACTTAFSAYGKSSNSAISNNCDGKNVNASPQPSALYSKIKNLPACNQ